MCEHTVEAQHDKGYCSWVLVYPLLQELSKAKNVEEETASCSRQRILALLQVFPCLNGSDPSVSLQSHGAAVIPEKLENVVNKICGHISFGHK